ncbi:MAG: hypothetical protein Q7S21_04460 [archaeon]|nr:hypothetical protein [archaeon]
MNDTLRAVLVFGSALILGLGLILPVFHILFDAYALNSASSDLSRNDTYWLHIQLFAIIAIIEIAMVFIALKFLRKNENIFLIGAFAIVSLIVSLIGSFLAFGLMFV